MYVFIICKGTVVNWDISPVTVSRHYVVIVSNTLKKQQQKTTMFGNKGEGLLRACISIAKKLK